MGALATQASVIGSYASLALLLAVLLVASLPPTTYRRPLITPAAAVHRPVGMEALAVQAEPVALKTSGLPLSPTAVAWRVFVPSADPRVQLTAAEPIGSPALPAPVSVVTELTPPIDPPPLVTVNVTATLGTPLPFASITCTVGLFASVEPGFAV